MVEDLSPHPLSRLPFPGAISSLLHKRAYTHANAEATPEATADFTYAYDAVGNVYCAWDGDGNEVFYFAQDAFGNELPVDLLGQDSWSTAHAAGITEHQTGKWIDPFTGLYYFQARYYDPVVGRFVSKDPIERFQHYSFNRNRPTSLTDPTGLRHDGNYGQSNYATGDALARTIKLLDCVGKQKHIGKVLRLIVPPIGRPGSNHEGWSIPVGEHKIEFSTRHPEHGGWYYIYDYRVIHWWQEWPQYWITDKALGDWLNAAIHAGSRSWGCWTLDENDFRIADECFCKKGGKFNVVSRIAPGGQ